MTIALGLIPAVLLCLGFPIFVVLLAAVTVALVFYMNIPLAIVHQTIFGALNNYPLLAIPFFLYAGELMGRGTVAKRLVDVVEAGVGGVRGGLGVATVGASAVFGAISGASAATVATIGRIVLPEMKRANYPEKFSAGLVTSVGAIDIIIPPSIPMIVYGAAAQESIPRLYAAGIVPGLLIAALLSGYVIIRAKIDGFAPGIKFNWQLLIDRLRRSAWALGAPAIILGGIYGGVFSPTEAAAVACLYSAIITVLVYRDISWFEALEAAGSTVLFTAQILIILCCASIFAWILTVNQVPAALVSWLNVAELPYWLILLAINMLLLIVGCFVDPLSAILVLTPLLIPVVKAAGVDTVHFGIILMVNLAIGLFHPPFGVNIFVAQSALQLPLNVIYRGILPFLVVYLIALAIITYVPIVSMVGVKLLYAN